MKRETRDQWVEALRSGEYKQAHGDLKNANHEYCCLGVLCDILDLEWERIHINSRFYFFGTDGHSEGSWLPKIPEKRDLKKELPFGADTLSIEVILADMNDKGKSFEEIADWIEENVDVE